MVDDRGNKTGVAYDQLGRRTAIDNPDTGLVEYEYDPAGNLTKKTTPNLRQESIGGQLSIFHETGKHRGSTLHFSRNTFAQIKRVSVFENRIRIGCKREERVPSPPAGAFNLLLHRPCGGRLYDYNRLAKIDYPQMADVLYSYGEPGAPDNRAGRIARVENGATISTSIFTVTGSSSAPPANAWTRRQGGASLNAIAANDSGLVGFAGYYPMVSANGNDWKARTPFWSSMNDVIWGGSLFVAVGDDGIHTSTDGMTWALKYEANDRLYGVVWSGSLFVAVGDDGLIVTSPDGISWTPQVSNSTDTLNGIAWADGKFVAVAKWGGNIFTSTDGITWQAQATGISGTTFTAVAGSGNLWVVTCWNGTVLTSADAETWTQQVTGIADQLTMVAWSPALSIFAATTSESQILTSADGISWTVHDTPGLGGLDDIIWAKDRFLAVGWGDVLSSSDGENWTLLSDASSYHSVTWGGNEFFAVGDGRTIATSSNGLAWSFARNDSIPYDLTDIVWSGSSFVATGSEGLYVSADGLHWTQTHQSEDTLTKFFNAVTWSGKQYLAVGGAGQIFLSPDGANWSSHNLPVAIELTDVTWTGNRFVAVGEQGAIYTSEDGIHWNSQISGTTETLTSIAWSGSRLVAAGDWGVLTTSVDGISWTKLNFLFSVHSYDMISWVGDKFVAVVYYFVTGSPDGITWSYNAMQADAYMHAAAFSPERKVLVGSGGTFYSAE